MDFVALAGRDNRAGFLWAASIARSLLAPKKLTRTTWQGDRHPCALWWGPVTIAETGDVMYSFENAKGHHCIEKVERPRPSEPQ